MPRPATVADLDSIEAHRRRPRFLVAPTGSQTEHSRPVRIRVRRLGRLGANPIDRFILQALLKNGLTPAPEADKTTLIRRVTFDLTGLPPTLEEVDAFIADDAPDAYERLIDRLLASPRYGERWARHWLDLVRYAESDGYRQDAFARTPGVIATMSSARSTPINRTTGS